MCLSSAFADGEKETGRFSINGLEIDLLELEALEQRVANKRQLVKLKEQEEATSQSSSKEIADTEPDYLDAYLERLQLNDRQQSETVVVESKLPPKKPLSLFQLLVMFMSIVSIAKLLYYGNLEDALAKTTTPNNDSLDNN